MALAAGAAPAAGAAAGFAAGFGGRLMRIVSFLACGLGIEGVAPAAGAAEGVVGTDGVAGVGLVFKFSAILNKNPYSLYLFQQGIVNGKSSSK